MQKSISDIKINNNIINNKIQNNNYINYICYIKYNNKIKIISNYIQWRKSRDYVTSFHKKGESIGESLFRLLNLTIITNYSRPPEVLRPGNII